MALCHDGMRENMIKREPVKNSDQVKVTFVVPHDPAQGAIYVVGDFNDWDTTANRLIRRSNNTRSVALRLPTGQRFAFRYYSEDGQWFNEPDADATEPNEYGSVNSILLT
uniref:Isoamylase n=2 Tax=Litorilinea aerophila TaxID=1204385 RepID=A0A540VEV1_9CHLR